MQIKIKAVKPGSLKTLNADRYQTAIKKTMTETAKLMQRNFQMSVRTWNGKAEFTIGQIDAGLEIYTTNRKYFWLNYGTKVRYATMTPDFAAKSQANSLSAGAGAGGVAFVNRQKPKPGIKARHFDKKVLELYEKKFPAALEAALKKITG